MKLGDVHKEIKSLETDREFLNGDSIKRFELANLYPCAGWTEAAIAQHRLLNNTDPALAKELLRLIKKLSKPA